MTKWKELIEIISRIEKRILVVSHKSPDGDAISSTLIVERILSFLGKNAVMVNHSVVPERFQYLKGVDRILQPHQIQDQFEFIITVDCGDLDRVGDAKALFNENPQVINIDHHKTNNFFGAFNVVDSQVAATVQILYYWTTYLGMNIDVSLSNMFYTGLITDTGGFKHSNTTSDVLRIAADLIEAGVNPNQISDYALDSMTPEYVKLLQAALSSLEISEDGRIAWISLGYDELKSFGDIDLDGIVQYTRNISGVEVGVFFREVDHQIIKISFRSKSFFDVAAFAQQHGGGGHARAAGCEVLGSSLEEVEAFVMKHLVENLETV